MIAQFEDVDENGAPSVGDIIRTNQYPLDYAISEVGQFQQTSHVVPTEFLDVGNSAHLIVLFDDGNGYGDSTYEFSHQTGLSEFYAEGGGDYLVGIQDTFSDSSAEQLVADIGAPSLPAEEALAPDRTADLTDNDYINVEIYFTG